MSQPDALGATEARFLALRAQRLLGGSPAPGTMEQVGVEAVDTLLRDLGAIQLDTISVLARSHELVPMARLGAVSRQDIHDAYWGQHPHEGNARAFEYWSHAACILPIESWPLFAARRRRYRSMEPDLWHGIDAKELRTARTRVLRLLRNEPLTATELGGAKRAGQWWSWSATKVALEHLLSRGELVCTRRVGWRRVYDLPERALPGVILDADVLSDDECAIGLIADAARILGVGTIADIADVHRLKMETVKRHVRDAGLVPVTVEGWPAAWAHPETLSTLDSSHLQSHTTLLSPFDSLVWFRERAARIFGMEHRLEAYTPAPKRIFGYFAMPVLHDGALVARVDPAREGQTLVAKRVVFETTSGRVQAAAIIGAAQAIRSAATWIGAEAVRIDDVVPATADKRLRAAIKRS
jgi:uncharacterized protein